MTNLIPKGWNDQALAEAALDLGYPAVTSRVVSNGAIDLVYYAVDIWNDRLTEDLSYLELENMRISDRIIEGIKIRLSYQIPYISRWNEACALGGLPQNAPYTLQKLTRIADDIWYIAGDRSADLNWYSKRGLLLSAYFTTEMFMLTDRSENYIETWNFLDRRIKDILKYGKYINTVKNYSYGIGAGLNSLTSLFTLYPNQFDNDIENLRASSTYEQQQTYESPTITSSTGVYGEDQTQTKIKIEIDNKNDDVKVKKQRTLVKKDPEPTNKTILSESSVVEDILAKEGPKITKKSTKKDGDN